MTNLFSLPLPKAHLVPSDEITVYYRCQPEGEYLHSVIQAHTDFILATTKAPLLPSPVPSKAVVIIEEKTQVWKKRLKATRSMLSLLNDYHVFVIPQAIDTYFTKYMEISEHLGLYLNTNKYILFSPVYCS